jgi:hypothetical protein
MFIPFIDPEAFPGKSEKLIAELSYIFIIKTWDGNF